MQFLTKEQIDSGFYDDHIRNELAKQEEEHKASWDYDPEYRNLFGSTPEEQNRYAPKTPEQSQRERGIVPDRNVFGDIGSNIARGVKDLTSLAGYGIKTLDPDGGTDIVERAGQSLIDLSKKADSWDIMKQDKSEGEGEGLFSRGWKGGIRSAVPSLAPLAAGVGTGASIGLFTGGPVGAAVGGFVGGTAATLGLFGLGTYGQKKEEYQKQGIDEERAHKAALKQAFIEGGIEEVSNLLGLLTFGFGKVAAQPLKQTAKELLSTPISTFAKNLTKNTFLNEVPTEMLQGALGSKIDENLGLLPEGEWQKQAVESIIPAMTMSVLFGVGAQGATSLHRNQIKNQLNSEDPQERVKAASYIANSIDDEELRTAWINMVDPLIRNGEPIDINADFNHLDNPDSGKADISDGDSPDDNPITTIQEIERVISNLEKLPKRTPGQESKLSALKQRQEELKLDPEYKKYESENTQQRMAYLEKKKANLELIANKNSKAKENLDKVNKELEAITGAEFTKWEADIRGQKTDRLLKTGSERMFSDIPQEGYSDTIPFAGVPNEEELGWMSDIERQRNPEPKRPLTQQEINQQRIGMTEALDSEIQNVPDVRSAYQSEQAKLDAEKESFLQKLDMMQNEVKGSQTRGVNQEPVNQMGETIAFSSNSPQWMRQIQEDRKADKKPALSRNELNVIFDKVRSGKELTERQQDQFGYVERAIRKYTGDAGEFIAQEEADDLEKRGFDLLGGRKMEVVNFGQGDRIVATVDGVKDEYLVKDLDENGKVILQDGVEKRVDMSDEISVEAHKPAGNQPETRPVEKEPLTVETINKNARAKDVLGEEKAAAKPKIGEALFSKNELSDFKEYGIDVSGVTDRYKTEALQQLEFAKKKRQELESPDYNENVKAEYKRIEDARSETQPIQPNQPVTWTTKKGDIITGTTLKKQGKYWGVKKQDGKNTFVAEKDLRVVENTKESVSDLSKTETVGTPDTPEYIAEIERREKQNAPANESRRLQAVGQKAIPGIRFQDAEDVGRTYEYYKTGGITDTEWQGYVDDLGSSNKIEGYIKKDKAQAKSPETAQRINTDLPTSKPDVGRFGQPDKKFIATAEGQKYLAARGSRVSMLAGLNKNNGMPYTEAEINNVADEKIDDVRDWLIKQPPTLPKEQRTQDNSGEMASPGERQDIINPEDKPVTSKTATEKTEPKPQSVIEDFGQKIGGARKDLADRGYSMAGKKKETSEGPAWKKQFIAAQSIKNPGKWSILDKNSQSLWSSGATNLFDSEAEAEKAIPLFAIAQNHRVYKNRDGEGYAIYKQVGRRKLLKVVNESFKTDEEAKKYMVLNAEKILDIKTTFGEEILPVPEIAIRTGEKRRDKDATPEMFMETFSPRGIEFGNWNNQEERQQVMNHAYDGLLDLAEALNIPPKALMLNGDLAISFGSRGQGLSSAKAHYERDYGVINLTKMRGAGSLAHEWFHAFDHYLGRQDTKAGSEKTANTRGDLVYPAQSRGRDYISHGASYKSKLRDELKGKIQSVISTMYHKAEQYVEDTEKADKFLSKARENLRSSLNDVRQRLTTDYSKLTKRFGKPATAEQLSEFDKLSDILVEGGNLETNWMAIENSRSKFGGRNTNDTLEAINKIMKAVRNRQGFNSERTGSLDYVRSAMSLYKERIKLLDSAKSGEEKTRKAPTNYAIEAKKMDQARVSDYWSEPHEMAARAFASYIEDKISEKGNQSDFIVYRAHGGFLLPMIDGFVARPYPEGRERIAINKAFDDLVSTLKTKQTDKGIALYQTTEDLTPGYISDNKKSVTKVPGKADITTGKTPQADGGKNLTVEEFEGSVGNNTHITKIEEGLINPNLIQHIQGESGEKRGDHIRRSGKDWEKFKNDIASGIKNPITIFKDYGKSAVIHEGNHRLDAAIELGLKLVPVEIRYFGHSEKEGLVLSPNPSSTPGEGVQYSSDQTPGSGVSLKDIQSRFKNQDVFLSPDGSISIRLKNGIGLKIKSVQSFEGGDIQFAIQSGRMSQNGVILGKYQDSEITLSKDLATNFTRDHELFHFMEDKGIITPADKLALTVKYNTLKSQGKLNFKPGEKSENLANTFAQILEARETERKGMFGKLVQKITDFVDGLLHIGRMSVRKLARETESGEVFGRDAGKVGMGNAKFQTAPHAETKAFKDWFGGSKVVDENGEPLVVYHGTPDAGFNEFDSDRSVGWFAENPKLSDAYSFKDYDTDNSAIYPVYLSIKKPVDLVGIVDSSQRTTLASIIKSVGLKFTPEELKREIGTDGVRRMNNVDLVWEIINDRGVAGLFATKGFDGFRVTEQKTVTWSPFSPTQIKSVYNTGTFDPKNPDIRYQVSNDLAGDTIQTEEDATAFKQVMAGLKEIFAARKDKGKNFRQDISLLDSSIGLLSHYSDKVPALSKMFDAILMGPQHKHEEETARTHEGEINLMKVVSDFSKKSPKEYEALAEYLTKKDRDAVGTILVEDQGEWSVLSEKDKNGKRKLLQDGFDSRSEAREYSVNREVEKYEGTDEAKATLKAFRLMTGKVYDGYVKTWNEIKERYTEAGLEMPDVVVETETGETRVKLDIALAKMGDRESYYFPRQRQNGDWRIIAKRTGSNPIIEYRDFEHQIKFLAGKYKAKGYKVEFEKVGSLSEDVYEGVKNVLKTQALVNQALSEVKMDTKIRGLEDLGITAEWRGEDYVVLNGGAYDWSADALSKLGGQTQSIVGINTNSYKPSYTFKNASKDMPDTVTNALYESLKIPRDLSFQMSEALVNQMADTLRSRGSMSRMISRSDAVGKDVPLGYETDPLKAIAQLVNSSAGGEAKRRVALETSKIITGRLLSWDQFREQHENALELADTESALEFLDSNTPADKKRIRQIEQEIRDLQKERTGVKVETAKNRQARLEKINVLYQEMNVIRKWADDEKAAELHKKMARLKSGMHKDYQNFVEENRINDKTQKNAYKEAISAVEDVLRNDEATDRVIGTLKGLASVWFLGGKISSAAINLTSMGTSVPAAMKVYGGIQMRNTPKLIASASKGYMSFKTGNGALSAEDKAIFEEFDSRGFLAAQLNMETINALKSGPAKGWGMVVEKLMIPFKLTEEFNRGVTLMAAYKGIRAKNPSMSQEDAIIKAKKVSDRAHGVYGKENMPSLLRHGRGLNALSSMYTFQTYFHNYMATLAQSIGRGEAKAAAYMVLSPILFGGIGSSLATVALKAAVNAFGGDDPEEEIYKAAEKYFGTTGSDMVRYGIPGAFGISLKGSLAPNLPDFSEPLDLLGPAGGMISNVSGGIKNIYKGNYLKGVEGVAPGFIGNVVKGYREATEGVTTKNNRPVFFGREQVKGDSGTAVMKGLGFNTIKTSKAKEIQWNESKLKAKYQERKTDIYNRYIKYISKPSSQRNPAEYKEIMFEIREFNNKIMVKGLQRFIPMITKQSIKQSMRSLKPPKKERKRQKPEF